MSAAIKLSPDEETAILALVDLSASPRTERYEVEASDVSEEELEVPKVSSIKKSTGTVLSPDEETAILGLVHLSASPRGQRYEVQASDVSDEELEVPKSATLVSAEANPQNSDGNLTPSLKKTVAKSFLYSQDKLVFGGDSSDSDLSVHSDDHCRTLPTKFNSKDLQSGNTSREEPLLLGTYAAGVNFTNFHDRPLSAFSGTTQSGISEDEVFSSQQFSNDSEVDYVHHGQSTSFQGVNSVSVPALSCGDDLLDTGVRSANRDIHDGHSESFQGEDSVSVPALSCGDDLLDTSVNTANQDNVCVYMQAAEHPDFMDFASQSNVVTLSDVIEEHREVSQSNTAGGVKLQAVQIVPSYLGEIFPNEDSDAELSAVSESENNDSTDKFKILQMKYDEMERKLEMLRSRLKKSYRDNEHLRGKVKKLEDEKAKRSERLNKLFGEDQMIKLGRDNMRGYHWSNDTIQKALRIRFTCGTTGYKHLKDVHFPLPSLRTLCEKMEGVNFNSGILTAVFELIGVKGNLMHPMEKYCSLCLDEMKIQPGYDYDPGTQELIGGITLPGPPTGVATHGLVFMLSGLSTRWKQVVAYEYTGNSCLGKSLKGIVMGILKESEKASMIPVSVTTDMGAGNQAMWRECGVGRIDKKIVNKIKHPTAANEYLYFIPDPPHVLKNIRNALVGGQVIKLGKETKEKFELPTDIVDIAHIRKVYDIERNLQFKHCPRLTEAHFNPSHYEKMKVYIAVQLIASQAVSSGLYRYVANHEDFGEDAIATAWFVGRMNHWLDLMSSKGVTMALSLSSPDKYSDAITFLQETIDMFYKVDVIQRSDVTAVKGPWKPFQTGVIMGTKSVIEMSDYLLNTVGFKFFMTSRVTQDCVENIFSTVRRGNPSPTAKELKYGLKIICVAQYLGTPATGNYTQDDNEFLLDFLKANRETNKKGNKLELLANPVDVDPQFSWEKMFTDTESEAFYYFTGYVVRQLIKKLNCSQCAALLVAHGESLQEAKLTEQREYSSTKQSLLYVSTSVLDFLKKCEFVFLANKHKLDTCGKLYDGLRSLMAECPSSLLGCKQHPLTDMLASNYARVRINISIMSMKKNNVPRRAKK